MKQKKKLVLSWSGGKDSTLALESLLNDGYQVVSLLTTVNKEYKRVSMHGVREELIERQAEILNIRLDKVYLPNPCSNEDYTGIMTRQLVKYKSEGIDTIAFGDIFLEDIKKYREENLAGAEMKGLFPLWGKGTEYLFNLFINSGYRSVITSLDLSKLDKKFAGTLLSKELLNKTPGIDPCGENGEFHTFVFEGPVFGSKKIDYKIGEYIEKENFGYIDLLSK